MNGNGIEKGSRWYRWDPHIHAPNTALSNNFSKLACGGYDFPSYLDALERLDPKIVGLGITDYLSIDGYIEVARAKREGRLENIHVLFPNIEFRLLPATKGGKFINAHLLVDPTDENHVQQIRRAQGKLLFADGQHACVREDIVAFGRALPGNSALADREAYIAGVNQFKISPVDFANWYNRDHWLRDNAIVVIATSSNDGLGALRDDGVQAFRVEIQRLAHAFFSSNDGDRTYWAGSRVDTRDEVFSTYGRFKPCLHGSDAHELGKLGKPDLDNFCWIKAEPTFSGFRQVLLEPELRVHIGSTIPESSSPHQTIQYVEVFGADSWYPVRRFGFPSGLTTIIGGKGSGKTALLDLVAAAGDAKAFGESSFKFRAREHLRSTESCLEWADGTKGERRSILDNGSSCSPQVKYLSQQFVDQLCTDRGKLGLLVQEIEDIVFRSTPDIDRLDASDFRALINERTLSIKRRRSDLQERIELLPKNWTGSLIS